VLISVVCKAFAAHLVRPPPVTAEGTHHTTSTATAIPHGLATATVICTASQQGKTWDQQAVPLASQLQSQHLPPPPPHPTPPHHPTHILTQHILHTSLDVIVLHHSHVLAAG
jgi:hypothetical protein